MKKLLFLTLSLVATILFGVLFISIKNIDQTQNNISPINTINLLEDFDIVPIGNFNLHLDDYVLDVEGAFIIVIENDTLNIFQMYPLRRTIIENVSQYKNIYVKEKW